MNTGVVLTLQGQTGRPREGRSGPSAAVPASRFLSGVEVVLCPRAANAREQLCPGGAHACLLLQTAEVLRARSPCSSSLTGNLLEMHVLRPSCTFGAETLEAGVSSLF